MNLEVYSDNHLLILNKPPLVATQPDLEELGKQMISRPFLHAVHRLDKQASGLVLLAKTGKALSRLNTSLREGGFQKKYWAIVEGILPESHAKMEDFLLHDSFRARVVSSDQGRYAHLEYEVVYREVKRNFTLVEITLHTGRYHQIRAQFSSRGYPILGDKKYGSTTSFFEKGIALHHKALAFPHPIGGAPLLFQSSPHWIKCLNINDITIYN